MAGIVEASGCSSVADATATEPSAQARHSSALETPGNQPAQSSIPNLSMVCTYTLIDPSAVAVTEPSVGHFVTANRLFYAK